MAGRTAPLRRDERDELLRTLRTVGPDAPTLCGGWTSGDIAAHLVLSEQAGGLPLFVFNGIRRVVPARVTRRTITAVQPANDRLIARARRRGWDRLLHRLATGPPRLFRRGTLADLRLVEEWVHHEDVRRAAGMPPRPQDGALADALWRSGLAVMAFPEFRLGRDDFEIALPDGRTHALGPHPAIRVTGPPGEVLLYLAGRGEAADVTVEGDPDRITALAPGLTV